MNVNFYWDAKYNSAYLYILFFHLLYLFEIYLKILNNTDKIRNIIYILKYLKKSNIFTNLLGD